MPKRFTLAEAQALIPSVDRLLRKALELKTAYVEAERHFESYQRRIVMMGGMVVDRAAIRHAREQRDQVESALRGTIEEVQELGCVVKDLDIGLVDFPTVFQGREVYLCWKLGEPAIAFWHGTDEGFAGRKAIDQDFRENHQRDLTQ